MVHEEALHDWLMVGAAQFTDAVVHVDGACGRTAAAVIDFIQNPIRPRRCPAFLARVVVVAADIELVRWWEGDARFLEAGEHIRMRLGMRVFILGQREGWRVVIIVSLYQHGILSSSSTCC